MLVTNLDYLARIKLPANIIEIFPRNESDGTRFSKFHGKRIPPNVEEVGHQSLTLQAWKNGIFCFYFKLFASGYALVLQLTASP